MKTSEFTSRTRWREKLEKDQKRVIAPISPSMAPRLGEGTVLIPHPLDVDALVRRIPEGQVITVTEIREALARQFGADTTCPLCTGIFLRIVAETAEEDRAGGRKDITPYWRVLSRDGGLNPRFPGGVTAQAERLCAENLSISTGRGKKPPVVAGYLDHLAKV